jgi:hypothetical protein
MVYDYACVSIAAHDSSQGAQAAISRRVPHG